MWDHDFKAESFLGEFSFSVRAVNPLFKLLKLEGSVLSDLGTIAEIDSQHKRVSAFDVNAIPEPFLSIRARDDHFYITACKESPWQAESDVVFEEPSFGPLAKISRNYKGTFREQLASDLGLGLWQVGDFQDGMSAAMYKPLLVQSFLAGLSLYFYLLESRYNTDYPSGS